MIFLTREKAVETFKKNNIKVTVSLQLIKFQDTFLVNLTKIKSSLVSDWHP